MIEIAVALLSVAVVANAVAIAVVVKWLMDGQKMAEGIIEGGHTHSPHYPYEPEGIIDRASEDEG